jgi:hypothetical protein
MPSECRGRGLVEDRVRAEGDRTNDSFELHRKARFGLKSSARDFDFKIARSLIDELGSGRAIRARMK